MSERTPFISFNAVGALVVVDLQDETWRDTEFVQVRTKSGLVTVFCDGRVTLQQHPVKFKMLEDATVQTIVGNTTKTFRAMRPGDEVQIEHGVVIGAEVNCE